MLMKGTWVAKSIAGGTPFKSIQRRKRQLVKRNNHHNHNIFFFFFTKHKGKQKPYLKENSRCMGFELEGKKTLLGVSFQSCIKLKQDQNWLKKRTKNKSKIVRVSRFFFS